MFLFPCGALLKLANITPLFLVESCRLSADGQHETIEGRLFWTDGRGLEPKSERLRFNARAIAVDHVDADDLEGNLRRCGLIP